MTLLAFVMPGITEMLIVVAIFTLLFGSSQIPKLFRNLGSSVSELRKGLKESQDTLSDLQDGV